MNNGESIRFDYNGGIQTYTIPHNGVYKLEVWGASSAYSSYSANGGYSKGYKEFKKGTILYIACGGKPNNRTGGFNGGGTGGAKNGNNYDGIGGGGATHIALVDGTLASIGKTTFDQQGLIVAGGAGGRSQPQSWMNGGSGGGTSGGSGGGAQYGTAAGGSQTSGYAFGRGGNGRNGGYDLSYGSDGNGGGGGGYYGGYAKTASGAHTNCGGGGGSGWIGGVTSYDGDDATTSNGANSGNGYAVITLIKKKVTTMLGNTDCTVYLGATEISSIYHGGIELWFILNLTMKKIKHLLLI